jgi:putative ABC transport system permease protein
MDRSLKYDSESGRDDQDILRGSGMREFVGAVIQDLRYTVRILYKQPGFTLIALLTLALGIGAVTAMFSVINAVLLRPLPYPEPQQLVRLARSLNQDAVTTIEFSFWKEHSHVFSSMAGYRGVSDHHLIAGNEQEWIKSMAVSTDFLGTLGVTPALGREFTAQEEIAGSVPAVVISQRLWREVFQRDPGVLGRSIKLDTTTYTIVGVLPENYWFPQMADALVVMQFRSGGVEDNGTNTSVVVRLQNGFSLPQAQAETANLSERFRQIYAGRIASNYKGLVLVAYQDWLVGNVRMNLLLLFGTTGFLFLMVCSNLASLLLARLASREKEIALRLALGSNSRRLLRQFLVENVVLSALGILAGLLVANVMLHGLLAVIPLHLPTAAPIRLDEAVLVFAGSVFLILALVFTLVPALNAGHLNVRQALKAVGNVAGTRSVHQRIRNMLVVGQVAVSTVLLVSACLLIQSLYRLHQEQLGFNPQGLISFSTPLAPDRYRDASSAWRFTMTVMDRVRSLPGVRGVAAINILPLTGGINLPSQREGHPDQSIGGTEVRLVTPDYFKVMGIDLLQGQSFTEQENAGTVQVAIVNETLAKRWWLQGNPLGDRITLGRYQGQDYKEIRDFPREIVGIAGDTKTVNLKEPSRPTVFLPLAQSKDVFIGMTGKLSWVIRIDSPAGMLDRLRNVLSQIDPTQKIQDLQTVNEIVASTTTSSRFDAWLFGVFAGLALTLAAVGVYGLLSYTVTYRRQEIGTRMALGATRGRVLQTFLKQGFILICSGLLLGIMGSLFLGRFLASQLYGIKPNDPVSFIVVSCLLLVIGFLASYIPSARATKIDPAIALRYE